MRATYLFLLCSLLVPIVASANNLPNFLTADSDKEYRATISHLRGLLPKNGIEEVLPGLASPYALLDVHPTKFSSAEDKNDFVNFNLGVMGHAIFKADPNFVTSLPNRVLCNEKSCRDQRLKVINILLKQQDQISGFFKDNVDITIVQRSDDNVFRVNNAFFTPAGIIQYQPSAVAGFVPSGEPTYVKNVTNIEACDLCSTRSAKVRDIMGKHHIAAMVKESNGVVNIFFDGISNNHWGVQLSDNSDVKPVKGQPNALGYQYDDVIAITPTIHYYQTN
ncbi:hypothetical protein H5202_07600 [Shewanella sp. SG41-4]|uniref:hypothetical protein n=1 Tax=Shewanella sp. SG41-4 TaxID=2760976 RepID=UPI00160392A1|nr:hypothetical protein [Shewanella sp. SG41-4]MBB1438555.1 hypothetical protein [Shewanella sp. SG41-4]